MCVELISIYVYVVLYVLLSFVLVFLFLLGVLLVETRKVAFLSVHIIAGPNLLLYTFGNIPHLLPKLNYFHVNFSL